MKNKILFIFISLFVLLTGVNKVCAYTFFENNGTVVDESYLKDKILENVPDFDYSLYPYQYCVSYTSQYNGLDYVSCNFMSDNSSLLNRTSCEFASSSSNILVKAPYFWFELSSQGDVRHSTFSSDSYMIVYGSDRNPVTNFEYSCMTNVLDFDSAFNPIEPEDPTQEGLPILAVATENFNNILSKASDICSYLFTQELFLMGLSVVLFYVSFLIIHRFMR